MRVGTDEKEMPPALARQHGAHQQENREEEEDEEEDIKKRKQYVARHTLDANTKKKKKKIALRCKFCLFVSLINRVMNGND